MLTRRKFLSLCAKTTMAVSLSELLLADLDKAVAAKEIKKPTVIWLELGSCTGNTISLDNTASPSVKELFNKVIDLRFHWIFMNAEGTWATDIMRRAAKEKAGEYILVVEGSVVLADGGTWDNIAYENGQLVTGVSVLKDLAPQAKHVIAIGSCAAFGGPAAARPNPSKSVGVQDVLDRQVINTPGCPCHPDWFLGTLYHLINYGVPELDTYNRPKLFYGRLLHDQCQRRAYFEKGIFAQHLGDSWCMFTMGCRGPRTFADCPNREWNGTDNWPVGCNTPCIGCVEPGFPDVSMPFFQRYPDLKLPGFSANLDKAALGLGVITLGGLGVHLGVNLATQRLRKNLTETSLPLSPPGPRTKAQLEGIRTEAGSEDAPAQPEEFRPLPANLQVRRPKKARRTLHK